MDLDWRVKNEKLSIHLMVEEVVEVANKELKIEGKLADIAKVWGGLELEQREQRERPPQAQGESHPLPHGVRRGVARGRRRQLQLLGKGNFATLFPAHLSILRATIVFVPSHAVVNDTGDQFRTARGEINASTIIQQRSFSDRPRIGKCRCPLCVDRCIHNRLVVIVQ